MKTVVFILILLRMLMPIEAIAQQPITLQWEIAGKLPAEAGEEHKGVAGAVIGWYNNILMVAGGANFPDALPWEGGKKKYHTKIALFEKRDHQFISLATNDVLSTPLAYAASCITKYGIAAVGGENESGLLSSAFLFKPSTEGKAVLIEQLPSLPIPTTNAVAVAIGDHIFIMGGETPNGTTNSCWKLDFANLDAGWQQTSPLPIPISFAYAAIVSAENKAMIVVLGGRSKTASGISNFSKAVFSYTLETGTWIQKTPLPYAISAGSSIALHHQGILLFGGDRAERFTQVEHKLVEIAKAEGQLKDELILQKNQLLATHPGFSNEVLLYNPTSGKTSILGKLPFPTPVTTTAHLLNEYIVIPSGEVRAGIRTPNILMAEIKYKQQ